jgi:hypothetical protein
MSILSRYSALKSIKKIVNISLRGSYERKIGIILVARASEVNVDVITLFGTEIHKKLVNISLRGSYERKIVNFWYQGIVE